MVNLQFCFSTLQKKPDKHVFFSLDDENIPHCFISDKEKINLSKISFPFDRLLLPPISATHGNCQKQHLCVKILLQPPGTFGGNCWQSRQSFGWQLLTTIPSAINMCCPFKLSRDSTFTSSLWCNNALDGFFNDPRSSAKDQGNGRSGNWKATLMFRDLDYQQYLCKQMFCSFKRDYLWIQLAFLHFVNASEDSQLFLFC